MIHTRLIWHILAASLALMCGTVVAGGAGTLVSKVELSDWKPSFKNLPEDAPRPVVYSFPLMGEMACGLLLKGSPTIFPLLEPDEAAGGWPSCGGIVDATSFAWKGQPIYVYRYIQKDTREDANRYDAFVRIGTNGIEFVEEINPDEHETPKTIAETVIWAKTKLKNK